MSLVVLEIPAFAGMTLVRRIGTLCPSVFICGQKPRLGVFLAGEGGSEEVVEAVEGAVAEYEDDVMHFDVFADVTGDLLDVVGDVTDRAAAFDVGDEPVAVEALGFGESVGAIDGADPHFVRAGEGFAEFGLESVRRGGV